MKRYDITELVFVLEAATAHFKWYIEPFSNSPDLSPLLHKRLDNKKHNKYISLEPYEISRNYNYNFW